MKRKDKAMKNIQTFQDNRQQIEGQQAKELDTYLQEFKVLEALIKDKTKELDKLKAIIKSYGVGYFETSNYIFDIIEKAGQTRINKDKLKEFYPNVAEDKRIYTVGSPQVALSKVERKS